MALSPKQLAAAWFERVWNNQDTTAIHELLHADCEVVVTSGQILHSPDDFVALQKQFFEACPSIQVSPVGIVESGNRVAGIAQFTMVGKNGQEVKFDVGFYGRAEDGKWKYCYNVVDFLQFCVQAGTVSGDPVNDAMVKLGSA